MLEAAFIAGLNHLLQGARWAQQRLVPHAGRRACLELPPLRLAFAITPAGLVETAPADVDVDVRIFLPPVSPLQLLDGLDKLMAQARVEGNAEFATELSFVFRHLRWDVEEDLAKLVGDVVAHRLVRTGKHLAGWPQQAATHLAENLTEYLVMESRALVGRPEWEAFRDDLHVLDQQLAGLERRLLPLARR